MDEVPRDVFHHSGVTGEDRLSVYGLAFFWCGTDVPQADCLHMEERPEINIKLIFQI